MIGDPVDAVSAGLLLRSDLQAQLLFEGTKQAVLIELLTRAEGATLPQMTEATGWQVHTVRGAMAGALKKKLGLEITSEKLPGADRIYRITNQAA